MKIECKICKKDLTLETIKMFEGKIDRVRCTCVKSYVSFTPNSFLTNKLKKKNIKNWILTIKCKIMKKLIGIIAVVILLASCGSTRSPYHACGITPLNKQYQGVCR